MAQPMENTRVPGHPHKNSRKAQAKRWYSQMEPYFLLAAVPRVQTARSKGAKVEGLGEKKKSYADVSSTPSIER